MRKCFILLLIIFLSFVNAQAQIAPPGQKEVQDAWLISKMVEKFHVQPRPLDHEMSTAIYTRILDELDPEKFFFTSDDIGKLAVYRLKLDEEISNRQSGYLTLLTDIFKQRLLEADTMIDHIAAHAFNFTISEKLSASEITSWPSNTSARHIKMGKYLKLSVLRSIIRYYREREKTPIPGTTDSLERIYRKKAGERTKRGLKRLLQSPQGFESMIGIIYCQVLANCYDPHTDYFPPSLKSSFETELGNKPLAFGFSLEQDDDGNPRIGHLVPGSPAFLSGGINVGDRIITIQWENKEAIDVSGAGLNELNDILGEEGGIKATLTLQKSDGTSRQISLYKAKLNVDDEDNKVKGFMLKGARNIGYISLPAFYSDWDDNRGTNGCANDVAREIIKMKKENMEGLILDLRYNGGGNIQEAVELSGLFIDAGPVGQMKDRNSKVLTLKDVTRGTVFGGPVLIMVNGSSASAAEMVAGTLQDYNRALIVGSPTYGKATAQIVLPMDTAINLENFDGKSEAGSYIKLTTSRLFRINGTTAQFTGVKPDILLPEPPDADAEREANEKFALQPVTIDANKYYHPLAPLPLTVLTDSAQKWIKASTYFQAIAASNTSAKKEDTPVDISLSLNETWKEVSKDNPAETAKDNTVPGPFKVTNLAYEQQRIGSDHELSIMNEERRTDLSADPYLGISYLLVAQMLAH